MKNHLWAYFFAVLFFPFTVLSMILIDQYDESLKILGQVFGWFSYLSSFFLVYYYTHKKNLICVFILFLLCIKLILILIPGNNYIKYCYQVLQGVLYCYVGMIILFRYPTTVYKQTFIFVYLNVFVMFLQISGLGGIYPQLLTTHGESNFISPVSTFFVSENDLEYNIIQGRPAGLMDANVLLSMFILFATALHYSRNNRLNHGHTALISLIIVLSMAKIAILGLLVAGLFSLAIGKYFHKIKFLFGALYFFIFLSTYQFFFPGLASYTLSSYSISTSFYLRANEIANIIFNNSDKLIPFFENTSVMYWGEDGEYASGISVILTQFGNYKLFLPILFFILVIYIKAYKKIKKYNNSISFKSLLILCLVGLFTFTHPIWTRPLFWALIGFGFLPLIHKFVSTPKKQTV